VRKGSDAEVTGLFHAGVSVADLDRALEFYVGALGLEVDAKRTATEQYLRDIHGLPFSAVRMAFLRVPNSDSQVELLEYAGVPRHPVRALPSEPGHGHICFLVDDIDALTRRLQAAGYRSRSERPIEITAGPNRGARAIYFEDPDGHPIEFIQRPRAIAPA
jgi:lactoylglutathione lyase